MLRSATSRLLAGADLGRKMVRRIAQGCGPDPGSGPRSGTRERGPGRDRALALAGAAELDVCANANPFVPAETNELRGTGVLPSRFQSKMPGMGLAARISPRRRSVAEAVPRECS